MRGYGDDMRLVNFEVDFKKEWSGVEIEGAKDVIKKLHSDIYLSIDSYMLSGNPTPSGYTSAPYAMLGYDGLFLQGGIGWEESYYGFDWFKINHIAITTDDKFILVGVDGDKVGVDDTQFLIELEPSDLNKIKSL